MITTAQKLATRFCKNRAILPYLWDDFQQEAVLCVIEEQPRVDSEKSSEKTWLINIINYRLRDFYRWEFGTKINGTYDWGKKRTLNLDEIINLLDTQIDHDRQAKTKGYQIDDYLHAVSINGIGHKITTKDTIRKAIGAKTRNRQIFTNYYLKDMTMQQIAQQHNISKSRVSQIIKSEINRIKLKWIGTQH